MKRVIALDPGGTTGWATYRHTEDAVIGTFDFGQIGPHEHHLELYTLLTYPNGYEDEFVTESFEYRNANRPGLVLVSKEYIGITKLVAGQRNRPFTEQTASKAKGFVRDSHLKRLDLWSSENRHAMDAMRHLIFYLVNNPEWKGSSIAMNLLKAAYKND